MRWSVLTTLYFERKSKKDESTGCWLWKPRGEKNRYGALSIEGKPWLAHRACWTVTHGEIPPGVLVCHKCDVPNCVNPDHLFLGSHKDNMQDAKQKGRMFTPSYFGFTRQRRIKKLTDSEVMDIYESKESLITLSKRFEVSMSTISHIRTGKRKHLVTGAMRE